MEAELSPTRPEGIMAVMVTVYGIPNCDTVKKARTWHDANGIAYTFHDFKKAGLDAAPVTTWLKDIPWDTLVNRRGLRAALSAQRRLTLPFVQRWLPAPAASSAQTAAH